MKLADGVFLDRMPNAECRMAGRKTEGGGRLGGSFIAPIPQSKPRTETVGNSCFSNGGKCNCVSTKVNVHERYFSVDLTLRFLFYFVGLAFLLFFRRLFRDKPNPAILHSSCFTGQARSNRKEKKREK